ncbi:hypothetical protein DZC73_25400 [Albitalea terrae]|uniref:Uncharacterized protein n=2 Tax=Piscinibacter terrae TaxID=2496871 RepID=A0A3N7HJS8_9BURK|nr:hypothetical protein DZC73_25400 [Albitalea terrae]
MLKTEWARSRQILTLVVLFLCGTAISSSAKAQQATNLDRPPAFFAEFRKQVGTIEGITVGPTSPYRLAVESGGGDYNFVEYLPWDEFRLTFDLNVIRTAEPILETMRLLKIAMQQACGHSKLEQRPLGPRHGFMLSLPTDKFMTEVYFRAFDEGLVGEFECQQADKLAPQLIRVQWDDGNRYPASVVPAAEWHFLVEGIGPDQLAAHRARFEQHRRRSDALRTKLAVGSSVQVMAQDVPAPLLARYKQPENRRKHAYAICALVTDVRGPLAQVQIQADTFMLPARKLLPMGRPASADEMWQHLQQQAPVQLACLK